MITHKAIHARYRTWLREYVDDKTLRKWMSDDVRWITEGVFTASICVGPYPIREVGKHAQISIPRMLRVEWYAQELERRANGGTVAEKVRL